MPAPQTEVIITVDGVERGRHVLVPGDYVIGRNEDCAICVDADLVSRQHAKLILNYDNALIEDLGSSNGTLVNDEPVTGRTRLWPSQKIRIGAATITLRRLQGEQSEDMSLAPAQQAIRRMLPAEMLREKKYDIGAVVARGGMGAILDAREAAIKRKVAMKVMLDTNDADDISRFVAEAQVTGQLEHPNIVPVHELGVDENGQPFYTMKMVRGVTLKKVLDLMAAGTAATLAKYPLAALLTVFQKVCDALAFAHSRGVIHRDLKPENIMIGDFGEVLVMDWGLAKRLKDEGGRMKDSSPPVDPAPAAQGGHDPSSLGATLQGTIMGTLQFMAPEQARGEIERIDARSDIYSLGAILYQILALRVSVNGTDAMEVVGKVGRGEIEPLGGTRPPGAFPKPAAGGDTSNGEERARRSHSTIPDSLAAVVRKAMSLTRTARYQSVAELQGDIEAYQGGFATAAEKAGKWKRFTLFVRRNKAASIGVAAVIFLTIGFMAKVISEGRRAEREAVRANHALTALKKSAPSLLALAVSEAGSLRFDSALEKLDAALAVDPAMLPAYWRRGWILLAQELLPGALDALRLAAEKDPANSKNARLIPFVEKMAAAPAAGRHSLEIVRPLYEQLSAAGALGEALSFLPHLTLGKDARLKVVRDQVERWLGKSPGGGAAPAVSFLATGKLHVVLDGLRLGNLDPLPHLGTFESESIGREASRIREAAPPAPAPRAEDHQEWRPRRQTRRRILEGIRRPAGGGE